VVQSEIDVTWRDVAVVTGRYAEISEHGNKMARKIVG
jgi:hypothetical protein